MSEAYTEIMPEYEVYVSCDQCGQQHSVNLKLTFDDENLNGKLLSDQLVGIPLPTAVAFIQSNRYRCPHTKQLFPASNIDDAHLFSTVLPDIVE